MNYLIFTDTEGRDALEEAMQDDENPLVLYTLPDSEAEFIQLIKKSSRPVLVTGKCKQRHIYIADQMGLQALSLERLKHKDSILDDNVGAALWAPTLGDH